MGVWIHSFFKYKIKRLKTDQEFEKFACEFKTDMGYEVPASFMKKGKLWAVINPKGEYVGGYAIVEEHPLRSLEEVPESYPLFLNKDLVGEMTSMWLKDKTYALPWSISIVWNAYLSKSKYWVYSYPISEVGLGKYYGKGDPICIYKGPIKRLEGHLDKPEPESVELITSWGVFKIAIARTIKHVKKLFKR